MPDLAAARRRYAARMVATARVHDARVEQAFARVPREAFCGPPPWRMFAESEKPGRADDPASLYADVLVGLDAAKGINNGAPSLHALMLGRLGVRPGDRVLHCGVGGGYYTAILAELAGPEGEVVAIEAEPRLAAAARENLAPWPTVTVIAGDAAAPPAGVFQRIYVNFGVARPAEAWLDQLMEGGSLVFPLCAPRMGAGGGGAVLRVARTPGGYAVRFVSHCAFIMASGPLAGDDAEGERLEAAFRRGGIEFAQSLRRGAPPPPERAWYWTPSWSLSYDPPPDAG